MDVSLPCRVALTTDRRHPFVPAELYALCSLPWACISYQSITSRLGATTVLFAQ